jgi:hypothetical protein
MKKRCLIIDDEDQSSEIEKMVRDGKTRGIELECEQFLVGSSSYTEVLTDGKIDTEKVTSEYRRRFKNQTFQLAAFDRDLSDDDVDGVELIRQLTAKKILKNTPKVIYSGLLEEVLAPGINNNDRKALISRVKTLVNSNIKGYFERDTYESDILNILGKDEESLDLIIEDELKKFPTLIFKNEFVNKKFKGKSYQEIAEMLDEYDHLRNDFKKEIVQQVTAYLTNIV